jgi:steroid 5-alpha reductase family enzyme
LPLQLSAVTGPTPRHWLGAGIAGVLVWLTGVVFEAVGDHQLRVFEANPAQRASFFIPRPRRSARTC